ncbi:hypothetical protein Pcinc_018415 [Petrolisthes cinctipes]|uniref:Uncharacterized protein n=1 Tax=Petrolisthes cinctipes TaxID=88211 RepID=A0AAE1FNM9_PETCI|nr:hypothetical protein Pcinc_018415 [Petrolisthes cinctipes]
MEKREGEVEWMEKREGEVEWMEKREGKVRWSGWKRGKVRWSGGRDEVKWREEREGQRLVEKETWIEEGRAIPAPPTTTSLAETDAASSRHDQSEQRMDTRR